MDIKLDINIDLENTVKKAVADNEEFHFYVDELTEDNCMPTYAGLADEKYTFDEMGDDFFRFIEKKRHENGVFIRLILATSQNTLNGTVFELDCCGNKTQLKINNLDNVSVFECADYGVKIKNNEITLGCTVESSNQIPFFAEFGSDKCCDEFLSLNNPLNQYVIDLLRGVLNE